MRWQHWDNDWRGCCERLCGNRTKVYLWAGTDEAWAQMEGGTDGGIGKRMEGVVDDGGVEDGDTEGARRTGWGHSLACGRFSWPLYTSIEGIIFI